MDSPGYYELDGKKIRQSQLYENCLNRPCSVYRHYSKDGTLLYVGSTFTSLIRLRRHRYTSKWFFEISRIEIKHYPCKEWALRAEMDAIKNEKPKYNITGVDGAKRKKSKTKINKKKEVQS